MVTRINEFEAAPGQEDALFAFLQSLVSYITRSEGCAGYEVLRHTEQPASFVVIEKWASEADHKQALAAFPKEQMQAAMPLFGAPPKGAYYH